MSFRRIVTAHSEKDEDGSDVQVFDDKVELRPVLEGNAHMAPLFSSLGLPATNTHHISSSDIDAAASRVNAVALPGGVNAQVTDVAPNFFIKMHRTYSIDYNIILAGSVTLITPTNDGGESRTEVRAGEIVIQRGTLHAWEAGPDGARWCTVVVAALPVQVEGEGGVLNEVDFK
ncbi:hypothetical protein JCM24511_05904 [Saitozyma sp. JCM 24511]|nr:hypothetical protein JCM24511_05904 [Saitozyma sp. JCM 24511]